MGLIFSKHEVLSHDFKSFYDIQATDIDGNKMTFEKNTVTMVVNVAAE